MEDHQPQDPANHDDADDAPDQHDWWYNADVSRLIDPEAFSRFLYSCDQLLEDSDPEDDDDEATSYMSDIKTRPSPGGQPKLG
jgi:hypothetical protein